MRLNEARRIRDILGKRVYGPSIIETHRGVTDYRYGLGFESTEQFVKCIRGKLVLDLGSGEGGLVKEVSLLKIESKIVSVNPRLVILRYRDGEKSFTSNFKESFRRDIQSAHDQSAVAAFAQSLPFKDQAFDVILDLFAIFFHAREYDEIYLAAQEMARVLRVGGISRMNTGTLYLDDRQAWDKRKEILEAFGQLVVLRSAFQSNKGAPSVFEFQRV